MLKKRKVLRADDSIIKHSLEGSKSMTKSFPEKGRLTQKVFLKNQKFLQKVNQSRKPEKRRMNWKDNRLHFRHNPFQLNRKLGKPHDFINTRKRRTSIHKIKKFVDRYLEVLNKSVPEEQSLSSYRKEDESSFQLMNISHQRVQEDSLIHKDEEEINFQHNQKSKSHRIMPRFSGKHVLPKLNLLAVARVNYHQEFISNAPEFSESWIAELDQLKSI